MRNLKKTGLAAMAAVLALSLFGCGGSGKAVSKAPKLELSEVRDEVILPNTDGAELELLNLENPIDYSYSSSNTDMIFKMADGVWLDAMDSVIPIDQEKFQAMADNFLKLRAVSKVENPGSLADYGLNAPAYDVYITDAQKGEISILIGAQDEAGNYYATLNERDVYTIKPETVASMVFDYGTLVIRKELTLPVTAADLKAVSVKNVGGTASYQSSDTEAMTRIAGGLSALKPVDYASYHATGQELTAAELTDQMRTTFQAEVLVNGEARSLTIYVGTYANADETLRYVMLDGTDMIMIVEAKAVQDLLNEAEPEA